MQITCDNSLKMNRFSYSASKQYISECLVPRDTFQASSYIPLFGKVTTASVADIQPLSTQDRAFVASYFSEYASIFTQHVLPLSRYKEYHKWQNSSVVTNDDTWRQHIAKLSSNLRLRKFQSNTTLRYVSGEQVYEKPLLTLPAKIASPISNNKVKMQTEADIIQEEMQSVFDELPTDIQVSLVAQMKQAPVDYIMDLARAKALSFEGFDFAYQSTRLALMYTPNDKWSRERLSSLPMGDVEEIKTTLNSEAWKPVIEYLLILVNTKPDGKRIKIDHQMTKEQAITLLAYMVEHLQWRLDVVSDGVKLEDYLKTEGLDEFKELTDDATKRHLNKPVFEAHVSQSTEQLKKANGHSGFSFENFLMAKGLYRDYVKHCFGRSIPLPVALNYFVAKAQLRKAIREHVTGTPLVKDWAAADIHSPKDWAQLFEPILTASTLRQTGVVPLPASGKKI